MTPLEEKVARAMCIAAGHEPDDPTHDIHIPGDPDAIFPWAGYRGQARAAIAVMVEAMREITPAITEDGDRVTEIRGAPVDVWRLLLASFERSALSPTTPTGGRDG